MRAEPFAFGGCRVWWRRLTVSDASCFETGASFAESRDALSRFLFAGGCCIGGCVSGIGCRGCIRMRKRRRCLIVLAFSETVDCVGGGDCLRLAAEPAACRCGIIGLRFPQSRSSGDRYPIVGRSISAFAFVTETYRCSLTTLLRLKRVSKCAESGFFLFITRLFLSNCGTRRLATVV